MEESNDKNCHLKEACKKELSGFELPIPDRCTLCTDNVKYIVECLENLSKTDKKLTSYRMEIKE